MSAPNVDYVVNREQRSGFLWVRRLVASYVAVVVVTLGVLIGLSSAGSAQATSEAWGHAIVVGVFALLLPVRVCAARRGRAGAFTAVGIIAGVLAIVNVVEAVIPHAFPDWMRVEMVAIALLMGAILVFVVRARREEQRSGVVAIARGEWMDG